MPATDNATALAVTLETPVSVSGAKVGVVAACCPARIVWTLDAKFASVNTPMSMTVIVLSVESLSSYSPLSSNTMAWTTTTTTSCVVTESTGISLVTIESTTSSPDSFSQRSFSKTNGSPVARTLYPPVTTKPVTTKAPVERPQKLSRLSSSPSQSTSSLESNAASMSAGAVGGAIDDGPGYIKRGPASEFGAVVLVLGEVPLVQRSILWPEVDVSPGLYALSGHVHALGLGVQVTVANSSPFTVVGTMQGCAPQKPRADATRKNYVLAVSLGVPLACTAIACIALGIVFWLRRRRGNGITPFYRRADSDLDVPNSLNTEKREIFRREFVKGDNPTNENEIPPSATHGGLATVYRYNTSDYPPPNYQAS